MARGSREALLSAPQQRHTNSEDVCTNDVEAGHTQKDRTKSVRHFHAHPENSHSRCTSLHRTPRHSCEQTHPSSAPSLNALDVGDVLLVLVASHWRWWKSVFSPSLMCSAPTPPDSAWVLCRHPLGSSSSWHALHNLIVLSIGNSHRSFRESPYYVFFFRIFWRT